ncbi:DUF3575 domain-containing protein [Porphyromonas asaccharolytica]|uniref:DUF3575 domain-containing protein n=1 Tax=Porphyromonas asaccharolytica (strain ATCC 25260 / DSM 20707 / BCRC 10618 / CCUG 7834 / JCM 6326 / LMG 13178 / VPI 4198 / B440) TaxID=879243 RepID=F4KK98_PORAD|nr:DUF3575 domain-containing protein [Porphyromonas asaccharolytica]AEE12823.1 hypothetical protein Poras_0880 [Porphyromonas asaccharolytica DSM 20707]
MMSRLRTKLTLLTIILTLGSLGIVAQEVVVPSHPVKYHEVRLNLLALPYASELSAEYEYATASPFSIGCAVSAYIGDESASGLSFPTFGVMPYGRWYFGGKWFSITSPNAGFLIEVNSAIGYYDKLKNVHYSGPWMNLKRTEEIVSGTSCGIGLGAGFKYVTRRGWSAEASLRMGVNLVEAAQKNFAYIYPAISVGYRF